MQQKKFGEIIGKLEKLDSIYNETTEEFCSFHFGNESEEFITDRKSATVLNIYIEDDDVKLELDTDVMVSGNEVVVDGQVFSFWFAPEPLNF
jgi:hypothetical protein